MFTCSHFRVCKGFPCFSDVVVLVAVVVGKAVWEKVRSKAKLPHAVSNAALHFQPFAFWIWITQCSACHFLLWLTKPWTSLENARVFLDTQSCINDVVQGAFRVDFENSLLVSGFFCWTLKMSFVDYSFASSGFPFLVLIPKRNRL